METEEIVDALIEKLDGMPFLDRSLILLASERLADQEVKIDRLESTMKKYAPCVTCKYKDQLGAFQPCYNCLHNIEERPGWELREE